MSAMRRPPQEGQKPRRLHEEGDEAIVAAGVAVEPKEAVGEDSTVEEGTQLTFDEARHAPLLNTCITEPGFQMVLDHPV